MKKCASKVQDPWILIGYFNNVLTSADRVGGKDIHANEFSDSVNMTEEVGLNEHDTSWTL